MAFFATYSPLDPTIPFSTAPLSGLYVWPFLGEEQRMKEVLEARTRRQLKVLGIEGEGLLLSSMEGGSLLVLQFQPRPSGLDCFRLAVAYPKIRVGPIPIR